MFATTKGKVCIGRVCVCEGETVLQDGQYFMKLFAPRLLLPLLGVCTLVGACLVLSLLHMVRPTRRHFRPHFSSCLSSILSRFRPTNLLGRRRRTRRTPASHVFSDASSSSQVLYRRSLVGFLGGDETEGETGYISVSMGRKSFLHFPFTSFFLIHQPATLSFHLSPPTKRLKNVPSLMGSGHLLSAFSFSPLGPPMFALSPHPSTTFNQRYDSVPTLKTHVHGKERKCVCVGMYTVCRSAVPPPHQPQARTLLLTSAASDVSGYSVRFHMNLRILPHRVVPKSSAALRS